MNRLLELFEYVALFFIISCCSDMVGGIVIAGTHETEKGVMLYRKLIRTVFRFILLQCEAIRVRKVKGRRNDLIKSLFQCRVSVTATFRLLILTLFNSWIRELYG